MTTPCWVHVPSARPFPDDVPGGCFPHNPGVRATSPPSQDSVTRSSIAPNIALFCRSSLRLRYASRGVSARNLGHADLRRARSRIFQRRPTCVARDKVVWTARLDLISKAKISNLKTDIAWSTRSPCSTGNGSRPHDRSTNFEKGEKSSGHQHWLPPPLRGARSFFPLSRNQSTCHAVGCRCQWSTVIV